MSRGMHVNSSYPVTAHGCRLLSNRDWPWNSPPSCYCREGSQPQELPSSLWCKQAAHCKEGWLRMSVMWMSSKAQSSRVVMGYGGVCKIGEQHTHTNSGGWAHICLKSYNSAGAPERLWSSLASCMLHTLSSWYCSSHFACMRYHASKTAPVYKQNWTSR